MSVLIVEGEDAAVADHAALGGQRVEVERRCRAREAGRIPPSGPPIWTALMLAAVLEAAGDVLAQLAHRHPERHLVDRGPDEALVEAHQLGPGVSLSGLSAR